MTALIDQILALSKPRKIGLLLVLIVLLAALDYSFLYSPLATRRADLSGQLEQLRTERERKKKLAADRPKLRDELNRLQGMLKEAVAQLPARKEIPDLLKTIAGKAREAGLEVVLFRPRGENYRDFYAEVPVEIMVRGDFHDMLAFFDEVGRLSRVVNLSNIELRQSKAKNGAGPMEAVAVATAFRFLEQAERESIAAEKAAKEKAKK